MRTTREGATATEAGKPRPLIRRLSPVELVGVLAALSGVLGALAMLHVRAGDLEAGHKLTQSLSQVIAEQTARSLQTVDLRLQIAIDDLMDLQDAGALIETNAREMLRRELRQLPFVRAIWVLDEQGRIAFDSDVGNIGVSLADREYFVSQAGSQGMGFYVAGPVRSRSIGTWMLGASRAVRDPGGKLRAVVAASVEPPFFDAVWRQIELGPRGVVALFDRRGRLMMRSPPDDSAMGKDFSQLALFTEHLPKGTSGVFRTHSPIDGQSRVTAYHVLPGYPDLIVTVGSANSELLAPWRRLVWMVSLGWLASVAIGFFLASRMQRQSGRLQRQADLLAMAGRLTAMGAWVVDLDAGRIRWSPEAAAILDIPAAEATPVDEVVAMMAPESLGPVQAALGACIAEGTPFDVEARLTTRSGRDVWVRSIGEPVRDASGRVIRIEGAQQDITALRAMTGEIRSLNAQLQAKIALRTEALERQKALFSNLAEEAPQPIWTVDARGFATFLSRAFYDLVGGEPPKWLGDEWITLVHPDDVMDVRRRWLRASRDGVPYGGTRRLRAVDGQYHTTSYRARPVRGESGDIAFWVGIDTDITELTTHQTALALANAQLESFSSSVSHDLRAPVQRIASFAQLLGGELQGAAPGRSAHYLERIHANALHMGELIDGLLALARVTQVDLARRPVDLGAMAREILAQLQVEQPERQVTWFVAEGLVALGDPRLLHAVMENLLGNAWKFTSRAATAKIEVARNADGEFYVRDNGAGFDMAYADKLFGTFQRLHVAGDFPGTGIGLATVARAIARQGGSIRGEGAPGQGATFYFTLPTP